MVERRPWHAGATIAERYKLRSKIAVGGAGEVWRAVDTRFDAPIAIKLLDPKLVGSEVAKRFLREARAAAQLRSLHVVQILDYGTHADIPYIAMELLEGETLSARLEREPRLPEATVCRIIGHVAKAAAKAHSAGIVHRDLKPDNIFLVTGGGDDDDEEEIAKVFDFGIAKVRPANRDGTGATQIGTILGTPQYMSPEQAIGTAVDLRTDVYALGIIAFELVTGALPFTSDDIGDVLQAAARGHLTRPSTVVSVPPGFDAWFAKATAFKPYDRFPTVKALATALRECLLLGP